MRVLGRQQNLIQAAVVKGCRLMFKTFRIKNFRCFQDFEIAH